MRDQVAKWSILGGMLLSLVLGACRRDIYTEPVKTEVAQAAGVSLQEPRQVTAGNESNFAPDISPNGAYVFYTSDRNGNKEIWVKRSVGGFGRQLTQHPADDFAPVVSPDGKKLAFISRRHDAAGDVEVMDLGFTFKGLISRGEAPVAHVASTESEDTSPFWFPDGKKLVFAARNPGQKVPQLMTVNLSDLKPKPLGDLLGEQPSVSRHGNLVAFARGGAIYVHDINHGKTEQLTQGGDVQDGQPQFSDDDKQVVFIRYADDTNHDGKINGDDRPTIWMMDLARQKAQVHKENYGLRQLTSAKFGAYYPQAKNSLLYVGLQTNEGLNIFKLPVSGQASVSGNLDGLKQQLDALDDVDDRTYLLRRATTDFLEAHQDAVALETSLMELEWMTQRGQRREAEWAYAKIKANSGNNSELLTLAELAMIGLDLDPLLYPKFDDKLDTSEKQALAQLQRRLDEAIRRSGSASTRVKHRAMLLEAQIKASTREFFAANQILAALMVSAKADEELAAEAALYAAMITPATADVDAAIKALTGVAANYPKQRNTCLKAANYAIQLLGGRNDAMEALASLRLTARGVPFIAAVAHLKIADMFFSEGKKTVAANEYRQIVDLYPESPEIMLQAATKLVVLDQEALRFDLAGATLDRLQTKLAKMPVSLRDKAKKIKIDFMLGYGEFLLKENEPGVALKIYAQILAIQPVNVAAHRGRIDALFKRKELEQHREFYEKKAAQVPGVAEWKYLLGYVQTYDIDQAEGMRSRLSAINTAIKTVELARTMNGQNLYVHQTLGWLYMQKNFFTRQYQKESLVGSFGKRMNLVADFFGAGDPDWRELALESYQTAYFLSRPESLERASLSQNLAVAYYAMSNFQKSLFYYLQRVKLLAAIPVRDPRSEAIILERAGRAAFMAEELELAEDLQRRALAAWQRLGNDQRIAYSLDALALTFRERGKYADAVEHYERLLRVEERLGQSVNLIGTLSNLGYCHYMQNDQAKALEYFADADAKLQSIEESGGKVANGSGKDDGIKVDLGGGGSAAKGFDLFSRRMLLLTFRAKIFEALARPDLALDTYRNKLALLKEAKGDKLARAEEISILENNIGALELSIGLHEAARKSFKDAEDQALRRRAKDQKDLSPAEVANRLAQARIELRLASLGLLTERQTIEIEGNLGGVSDQLREAYSQGAKPRGRPLAESLALAAAFRATRSPMPDEEIRSKIAESLKLMRELDAPPAKVSGPMLTLGATAANKPLTPEMESMLEAWSKESSSDQAIKWKILYQSGQYDEAFGALEKAVTDGLPMAAPTDRALGRSLFEALLERQQPLAENTKPESQLMRRYLLLRLRDLVNRTGFDSGKAKAMLAMAQTKQIQDALSPSDTLVTLHKTRGDIVYAWIVTNQSDELIKLRLNGQNWRMIDSYADLAKRLPGTEGGAVYFVPSQELYDLPWEQLRIGGKPIAGSRAIAFLPAPDLLVGLSKYKRMTKGSVALVGPTEVPVYLRSSADQRLAEAIALDGKKPLSSKLSPYELIHIDLPLLLNQVEPNASVFKSEGQSHLNDLTLRGLSSISLPLTTAIVAANTRYVSSELQGSGEGFDGWVSLSLAATSASVPSVLIVSNPTPSDWPKFYRSLEKMSVAEASAAAGIKGRVLGLVGIPGREEAAYASANLEATLEEAEDALADLEFEKATVGFKKALYLARRSSDRKSEDQILKNLVSALNQRRDYGEALRYQLMAAAKLKPSSSAGNKSDDELDAVDYANALVGASVLAVLGNRFEEAAKLMDEAEVIFAYEGMTDQLGKIWQYRGINFENQKKYKDTIAAYKKAEEFYRKHKPEEAANQLLRIGNIYNRYLSDYRTALDYYDKAIKEFQRLGKPDLYIPVLIEAADVKIVTGELEEAIRSLEIDVVPKLDEKKQRGLWVQATQKLANAYYRAGLYQKAKDLNKQTLEASDKIEKKLNQVNARLDAMGLRAMIAGKLGHYREAFKDFHDAITSAQEYGLKSQIALLYNNYGFWARDYGAVDESIKFFNTALRIDEELESRSAVAFDHRNLGLSLILTGDYNAAADLLQSALKVSEDLGQVYNAAYCHFGLADIAMRRREWRDAEAYFAKALAIADKGFMRDMVWRAHAGIAAASLKLGQVNQAEQAFEKAIGVIESMRAGLQSDDSRSGFFSDAGVQNVYASYASVLMDQNKVALAWNISERSRSRAFVDSLGAQKMRLAGLGLLKGNQATSFDQVQTISAVDLAKLVGSDTAVVEYHVTPEQLLIWVLRDGKIQGNRVAIKADSLRLLVQDYRELMENYSSTEYLGGKLAEILIKPVLDQLGDVKRLAIVPHGSLHFFPFASLPLGSAGIVDKYALFYLDSATVAKFVLADQAHAMSKSTKVAALTNPLSSKNVQSLLPFADREGEVIGRYFPTRKQYSGSMATEAQAVASASQADILHFGVHGEFKPTAPSESRLLLADSGASDNALTVADMLTLPLKAKLVTLSACDSGLGRITRGDEIVGMDRALFYAGASTVVSSLWRVSDVANAVVMKRFYRYLAEGDDKATAMRKAQLVARRYFAHPVYWSSFKVSGDFH